LKGGGGVDEGRVERGGEEGRGGVSVII